MRTLLTALLLATMTAVPAAHALSGATWVDYAAVEVTFNAGIFDPNDPSNTCVVITAVRTPTQGFVRSNAGMVALQGQTQGTPGSPPVADPTDCAGFSSPGNLVGASSGDARTGSSLYFGGVFEPASSQPGSLAVTLGLCPVGSETIVLGQMSCAVPYTPVALPPGADPLGDLVFLSDLALPFSGFLRVCYTANEWDSATASYVAVEKQDYLMAVTWDDLVNDQAAAADALLVGLLAPPPQEKACT